MNTNRFYDVEGDVSTQLAPWVLRKMGKPIKRALFKLKQPIRFRSNIAGGIIVIPVEYISDLASIPQFAWSIFMKPDDPRIELGGWIHDYLYGNEGKITLEDNKKVSLTREQSDDILTKEAMPDLLASDFICSAVYYALRLFGKKWKSEPLLGERFHWLAHRLNEMFKRIHLVKQ